MKALVYHGPGKKAWEEVPDPQILAPTDAIVKIDTTTICGTDPHILKGNVPAGTPGRVLGHEDVGIVTEAGPVEPPQRGPGRFGSTVATIPEHVGQSRGTDGVCRWSNI